MLFTNRRAVVVPASFVEDILKRVTLVLEYNRVLEPVSCFGKAIKFCPAGSEGVGFRLAFLEM